MSSPASVYRIFRRGDGEMAANRPVIIAMIIVATALAAAGVYRVNRQHAVLRHGYELSRRSEQVRQLRETRRQLELERATLSAPDRIRRLASALGMQQVLPDRIRVVTARPNKVAIAPPKGRR